MKEYIIVHLEDGRCWLTDGQDFGVACDGLPELLEAVENLLASARDTGECFVDQDHDKYDPANPEQMWTDWAELDAALDKVKGIKA